MDKIGLQQNVRVGGRRAIDARDDKDDQKAPCGDFGVLGGLVRIIGGSLGQKDTENHVSEIKKRAIKCLAKC